MKKERESHTRQELLFRRTKVLCREHGSVQLVTDAFQQTDGLLLKLACGCRRPEKA